MMIVCISRGAKHKHQAKHQGGGLPFCIQGCLQLLWGQAPFPRRMQTRQASGFFTAMRLAVQCPDSERERQVPVDIPITESSLNGTGRSG